MNAFVLAWNFLTIIPLAHRHEFRQEDMSLSLAFYPVVGFLLGAVLYLLSTLLEGSLPQNHLHVMLFVMLVIITGALHVDGFSDSIDALYVPKERVLEVMKDPHVGAMGVIFTATFLIAKASSFIYMEHLEYLLLILALSRYNALIAIYFFRYVSSGFSGSAKEGFERVHFILATLFVTLLALIFDNGLWIMVSSVVTLVAIKYLFYKKIGGFSGDVYGLSIEVSELVMLNVAIVLCK